MKFKFKGYELDTKMQYIDVETGDIMRFTASGDTVRAIFMDGIQKDADDIYMASLRQVTLGDPIKKEPKYEIGKYYLFSDNNSNWVTSMLRNIDDGHECRYCTGSLHYRFIKPIPADMIGKII